MKLIDTHCHVHFNAYAEDAEAVILRAQKAGIGMITIGTQREESARGDRGIVSSLCIQ